MGIIMPRKGRRRWSGRGRRHDPLLGRRAFSRRHHDSLLVRREFSQGPWNWMSPEAILIRDPQLSALSDSFAIGRIL